MYTIERMEKNVINFVRNKLAIIYDIAMHYMCIMYAVGYVKVVIDIEKIRNGLLID